MNNNNSLLRHIPWLALAVIGACALGVVALRRGEAINALWIVVAAVAIYLVAYRYYSLFIATKVMQLDPRRATPAVLNNDGLDYVPTNKHILFGHHFAANQVFLDNPLQLLDGHGVIPDPIGIYYDRGPAFAHPQAVGLGAVNPSLARIRMPQFPQSSLQIVPQLLPQLGITGAL